MENAHQTGQGRNIISFIYENVSWTTFEMLAVKTFHKQLQKK